MMNKATAKEAGAWEVKRRIRIPNLTRTEEGVALEDTLADVDGVLQVSSDPVKRRVLVDYLSTKTDYQSLEQAAAKAGFPPATGLWACLRAGGTRTSTSRAGRMRRSLRLCVAADR